MNWLDTERRRERILTETKTYEDWLKQKPSPGKRTPAEYKQIRDYVRKMAQALSFEGGPEAEEQVCAKIVKDLKGSVSADVVRSALPARYKNQVMKQRSAMQRSSKAFEEYKEDLEKKIEGGIYATQDIESKPEIRPTANILKGSIRARPPQEVVMSKEEMDEAVLEEAKAGMEEEKQRIYELHADLPQPQPQPVAAEELTESDKQMFEKANTNGMHQEVVLRAGKICEDAARILLRSRPYNEIYLRIRRGTNLVDMVESDADRQQNKTKWMGVRRH